MTAGDDCRTVGGDRLTDGGDRIHHLGYVEKLRKPGTVAEAPFADRSVDRFQLRGGSPCLLPPRPARPLLPRSIAHPRWVASPRKDRPWPPPLRRSPASAVLFVATSAFPPCARGRRRSSVE